MLCASKKPDCLWFKMWNIYSWGAPPGNPVTTCEKPMLLTCCTEKPLVGAAVHNPSWAQPLCHPNPDTCMGPLQDSSPNHSSHPWLFESSKLRSQTWKNKESILLVPGLNSWPQNQDQNKKVVVSLLRLGVTCYAGTDNSRNSSRRLRDQIL